MASASKGCKLTSQAVSAGFASEGYLCERACRSAADLLVEFSSCEHPPETANARSVVPDRIVNSADLSRSNCDFAGERCVSASQVSGRSS